MIGDATIDPSGRYRYHLSRAWGDKSRVLFVMLNPSTADTNTDDPTVRKCMGFASRWGCDGIEIVNLFAHRATNPDHLLDHPIYVGPDNDRWIRECAERASLIVCAWGAHPVARRRAVEIWPILAERTCLKAALRINDDGSPAHPLYIPFREHFKPFRPRGVDLA